MSTLVLHVPWTQDIDFFIKGPSKIYKNYIESQSNLIKVTPANIYVNVKKFYSDIKLLFLTLNFLPEFGLSGIVISRFYKKHTKNIKRQGYFIQQGKARTYHKNL